MSRGHRPWVWAFSLAAAVVLTLPLLLMPLQRRFYATRFPDDFARWPMNGSFSAVEPFFLAKDVYTYAARAHQAALHALPGDAYVKGNDRPRLILRDFVTFEVLGLFNRLVGLSAAWTLAQLVFSALWVSVLYWLLLEAGLDGGAALALAVLLTLFNDLTRLAPTFRLRELAGAVAQYLVWPLGSYTYWFGPTRFTRPLVTYPFLFAAVVLAVRAGRRRDWGSALAAGALGGVLVYVHPDVWAAYGAATGLFFAWLCWRERALLWPLAGSLVLSAAVSAPWAATTLLGSEDAAIARHVPRTPDPLGVFYAGAAFLILRAARRNGVLLWSGCLVATMSALLNVHLITGVQGDNVSLWWYLGNTFTMLGLGALLFERLKLSASAWRWLAACLLLAAIPRELGYSILHYRLHAQPASREQALRWLDENAPEDSVVASLNPMMVYRFSMYTKSKALTSHVFPLVSDISYKENARRILRALSLFGVDRAKYVAYGFGPAGTWERALWLGQLDIESEERSISDHFLNAALTPESFAARLDAAASDPGPQDYEADYLWVGAYERALLGGRPPKAAGPVVFSNADVAIYAVAR